MQSADETARYIKSCATEFWQRVFSEELQYLLHHLKPEDEILSVGCGPAILERSLAEMGYAVTGLDVSQQALSCAPDSMRTVAAAAEEMPFPDASFDVALFVASLQFIDDYSAALKRASVVLRPGGRLIAMLINPASKFFKTRYASEDSYVRKLKHTDMDLIEHAVSACFQAKGEYFLGIDGDNLFKCDDPALSALYILNGVKAQE